MSKSIHCPTIMTRRMHLLQRLDRHLPDEAAAALRCAVEIAKHRGESLYLVGGAVRDLLLGAELLDLDLVTEGDAISVARAVAKRLRARCVAHERFGTAAVRGERFQLDVARARAERYERPGALPQVRSATFADDLARRDFSINAMALRLVRPDAGELLDPFGGRNDLSRRCIRVLHDESFRDDATRMLRATRYAGRFRFRIDGHTARLLARDLAYLDTISGARLRREFERVAGEERCGAIARLAHGLGILRAAHPALEPGDRALRAVARLQRVPAAQRSAVLFALLLSGAKPAVAEEAIARLSLTGEQARAARGLIALRRQAARLGRAALPPSAAARVFEQRPPAAIEAFSLLAERRLAAQRASRYLGQWRHVRPRLNGRDVVALGVPPGPQVGAALSMLRDARLDARVRSREDEEALVRRTLADQRSRRRSSRG